MAMVFSEVEFQQFKQFVVLSVGLKLRVPDAESKSAEELQSLVSSRNQKLGEMLALFLNTYDDWYGFHLRINQSGKAGNLNAPETAELVELVRKRDERREQLIKGIAAVV